VKDTEFQEFKARYPDLAKFYHYVQSAGPGRPGYWRRIPRTYFDRYVRPNSLLRSQLAFGTAAYDSFGQRGFEKGLPIIAHNIKTITQGRNFKEPVWKKALRDLKAAFKGVAEVVETTTET
jgi:hypothetical protein